MYRVNQLAPTLAKGKWGFDPAVGTIVTEFASGHGFTTSGADASSNVNDTAAGLAIYGSQCATVVSAGTGASAILQNTSIASTDTTNLQILVALKIDDITHLSSLYFSLGNGGFTNEYHIPFADNGAVASGQWVVVSLSMADAATQGSPTRTGITALRVYHKDDNTGNKVTVHWGGIYFMPNAANQPGTPYPKGVASICFDDSYASQWTLAKPLLDQSGLRASAYTIKDYIGTTGFMTLPQIQSLQDQSGWEVGAHSYLGANHTTADTGLTAEQLVWDKSAEKEWLLNNGLDGQGYAYPKGLTNTSVVSTIRRYYRYARTTAAFTETYPAGDPYRLKSVSGISTYSGGNTPLSISQAAGKIDASVTNASWLILTFHRIIPTITSVTVAGTTATVTFSANHPFFSGQSVTFAGFTPSGLNVTANITCGTQYTTNTLTYTVAGGTTNATVMGTALSATTDIDYTSFAAIIAKLVSTGIAVRTVGDVMSGQGVLPPSGGSGAVVGSVVPSDNGAQAAGSSLQAARADHVHGAYTMNPIDHGMTAWTYDPVIATTGTAPTLAGTAQVAKMYIGKATTISNIYTYITGSGGTGLSNSYVAIYQGGNLLVQSADQSTSWQSSSTKTIAVTPTAVTAGYIYIVFWVGAATTLPTFARAGANSVNNINLAAASARYGTANTGLTTTAPGTLGTISGSSQGAWWWAVS